MPFYIYVNNELAKQEKFFMLFASCLNKLVCNCSALPDVPRLDRGIQRCTEIPGSRSQAAGPRYRGWGRVVTLVLSLLLVLSYHNAFSTVINRDRNCGKYIFNVEILTGSDEFEQKYRLYYQEKGKNKIFFYETKSAAYIIAACVQNNHHDYLMFFQEFCGGNGCPEDMYGVFDPYSKKILLNPTDWPKGNNSQLEKILGYDLPSLDEDKRAFCCLQDSTLLKYYSGSKNPT